LKQLFSDQVLNDIASRIDILELVSEYVELKRSGQSYRGLCPFHNEKTPSFFVNQQRQCFKCFGCQKGGGVISFYKEIEGIPFRDAVYKLAKRAGITLPPLNIRTNSTPLIPSNSYEELLSANRLAAEYFHYILLNKKTPAKDYLLSRKISDKSIKKFMLGVTPNGWNDLTLFLQKKRISLKVLQECGLTKEKDNNFYDHFRNRIIFPIRNIKGEIVGFGGRVFNDSHQPKYLNSPESPIFSKRTILYGLYENQRHIRQKNELLLVEGYMDVIVLSEFEATNAVATMGTSLTDEHCKLIKSITSNVVTIFDSDPAGIDAWHRTSHLFINHGIIARDLSLPASVDPDEFIVNNGKEAFYSLCQKAPRQVTKILKEISSKGSLSENESEDILNKLMPLLVSARKYNSYPLLIDNISLVLGISTKQIQELTEKCSNSFKNFQSKIPISDKKKPLTEKTEKPNSLDLAFFKESIYFPLEFQKLEEKYWKQLIIDKTILKWLEKLYYAKEDFNNVLQLIVNVETNIYLLDICSEYLIRDNLQNEKSNMKELVKELEKRKKEREIKALKNQIFLNQRLGNEEEQLNLLEKLRELRAK